MPTPLLGHRHARGVPEVRDGVHERRPLASHERLLQLFDEHAVVVDLDRQEPWLIGAERGEGADVGGRLDRDHVAGIDEDLADEIERLLRAGRDDHVVGVGVDVLLGHQHRRAARASRADPWPPPYCSATSTVLGEHRARDVGHLIVGERLDERHAAGERHDLRAATPPRTVRAPPTRSCLRRARRTGRRSDRSRIRPWAGDRGREGQERSSAASSAHRRQDLSRHEIEHVEIVVELVVQEDPLHARRLRMRAAVRSPARACRRCSRARCRRGTRRTDPRSDRSACARRSFSM